MAMLILSLDGGGGRSAVDVTDILEDFKWRYRISDSLFRSQLSKRKHPRDAGDLEDHGGSGLGLDTMAAR